MTTAAYFAETWCPRCHDFEWTHVSQLVHALVVSLTSDGRDHFPPNHPSAAILVPAPCDLCAICGPSPFTQLTGRTLIRGLQTRRPIVQPVDKSTPKP